MPAMFVPSGCSLKPLGLRSISSLPASLTPRQPPSAAGLARCCWWHPRGHRRVQQGWAQHSPCSTASPSARLLSISSFQPRRQREQLGHCDSGTGTRDFILSIRSQSSTLPDKQRKGFFKAKCLAKRLLSGLLGFMLLYKLIQEVQYSPMWAKRHFNLWILPGHQDGAGFVPSLDSAQDVWGTAEVRPPSNRKAPSTKRKMINLHLGNNRKKKNKTNHNIFSTFIPFSLSTASQQYKTQLPSKRSSCTSFLGFIHHLCTKSRPNPCDWSGINDLSLHGLLGPR